MSELVQTLDQVLDNARAFQDVVKQPDSKAAHQLDHFFHWYFLPAEKIFAPAKFIGYKDSNVSGYRSHGRHVHDAQEVLSQWFERVEPTHHQYAGLQEQLNAFLAQFGAHLHEHESEATGGIYTPR